MMCSRRTSLPTGVLFLALGALALPAVHAHADLVYTATGAVGNIYTYDLNFSTNIDGPSGMAAQRLEANNFATLYDISGLNTAILNPAYTSLFTLSTQNVGITPGGTAPTDDPGITNITLTYTGPNVTTDQSFTSILQINSSFTTVNPLGQFTSLVTKNIGADAGSDIASIGNVAVPGVDTATPEPGSLALFMGAALSGSVFVFRRRRTRK